MTTSSTGTQTPLLASLASMVPSLACASMCLGGTPLFAPGFDAYAGCAPARFERASHFELRRDFWLRADAFERTAQVFGGTIGSVMMIAGIQQGAEVLRVDGHPVNSVEDVQNTIEKMPHDPPMSITVRINHRAGGREIP